MLGLQNKSQSDGSCPNAQVFFKTYRRGSASARAPTTAETASTAPATATTTAGWPLAAFVGVGSFTATHCTLRLGLRRLGLAGNLDGDLALQDLLAGQLLDGRLRLGSSGKVDEGVADRAVGARVDGNGDALTARGKKKVLVLASFQLF